ncbi:hypothetical protein BC834DRAFT_890481, partial [Gloeopeniophorella convolvens]
MAVMMLSTSESTVLMPVSIVAVCDASALTQSSSVTVASCGLLRLVPAVRLLVLIPFLFLSSFSFSFFGFLRNEM